MEGSGADARAKMLREYRSTERGDLRDGRLRRPPQTEHGREVRPQHEPMDADRAHEHAKVRRQCLYIKRKDLYNRRV